MSGKLAGMSLVDLLTRRALGRLIIRQLMGAWAKDERAPVRLVEYRAQVRELTAEIQRRRYPEGAPAQVIGLKSQSLSARRH